MITERLIDTERRSKVTDPSTKRWWRRTRRTRPRQTRQGQAVFLFHLPWRRNAQVFLSLSLSLSLPFRSFSYFLYFPYSSIYFCGFLLIFFSLFLLFIVGFPSPSCSFIDTGIVHCRCLPGDPLRNSLRNLRQLFSFLFLFLKFFLDSKKKILSLFLCFFPFFPLHFEFQTRDIDDTSASVAPCRPCRTGCVAFICSSHLISIHQCPSS